MTFRELFQYRVLTISNFLSLSRVIAIPLLWHYTEKSLTQSVYIYYALGVAFYMVLSDFLDGFLARLLGQETPLGQYLDPLADKLGVISTLFLLYLNKGLPLWFVIFILIREIAGLFFGSFLLFRRNLLGKPNYWGKFGVFFISISFLFYLLDWQYKKCSLYFVVFIFSGGMIKYTSTYWKTVFLPIE